MSLNGIYIIYLTKNGKSIKKTHVGGLADDSEAVKQTFLKFYPKAKILKMYPGWVSDPEEAEKLKPEDLKDLDWNS